VVVDGIMYDGMISLMGDVDVKVEDGSMSV